MLAIGLFVGVLINSAFAEDNASPVCTEIAALEDAGSLTGRQVVPARAYQSSPKRVEIDLDGDGVNERVEKTSKENHYGYYGYEIEGRLLWDIAPEYQSATASHDGIVKIDGAYFGLIRDIDILAMAWRFEKDETGDGYRGQPVCFFDREWKEAEGCERFNENDFKRAEVTRPLEISLSEGWERPRFLEDVYALYYGIKKYAEPITIDIDNDGKPETVGTYYINTPAPRYGRIIEVPVILTSGTDFSLEPSFQNARLIQYVERVTPGGIDIVGGRISFLVSKAGAGGVFIETRSEMSMLSGAAPRKPIRLVYRLDGAWPEKMCRAEFDWRTVYTTDDLR